MRSLNDALESLLYRKAERDAFLAGDRARFGLSPEDEDALAAIDHEQLVSAATLARAHVFERRHRGVGSLLDVFPETIAAWKGERDDLASAFVESDAFGAYRSHAHSGKGISLEEAFFRFAEARAIGDAPIRLRELAFGLIRVVALSPEPTFTLPDIVRRAPRGHYAVLPDGPTLMAVLDGKFVRGAITATIAALLTGVELPETAERPAVEQELAKLGLR